jgi:hypothetical protein
VLIRARVTDRIYPSPEIGNPVKIGNGPAAVVPLLPDGRRTLQPRMSLPLNVAKSCPKKFHRTGHNTSIQGGKAAEREGESEDLPELSAVFLVDRETTLIYRIVWEIPGRIYAVRVFLCPTAKRFFFKKGKK